MSPPPARDPSWLRLLPAAWRQRLIGRVNLHDILHNIGWLFADKVLRMGTGLLVSVWVARYLGPDQFGLLNYALAVVAIFGVLGSLGLNSVVVRELSQAPGQAAAVTGAAFGLQCVGGLLAMALAVAAVWLARPADPLAHALVAILSLGSLVRATDVVKYHFEARVQSKYVVWVENAAFLTLAAVRVLLILAGAPLLAFAWALLAEAVLVALGLLAVYARQTGLLQAWRLHIPTAKRLLADSWPLMLSGLAIMVYMRVDQIMLGQMLGDEAVGVFSAAVRVSELWYFIPAAIVASTFPAIIKAKQQGDALYEHRLQQLYRWMVRLALAVALPMSFFSGWVVGLLYGEHYAQAAPVLALHIWTGVFVSLGTASGGWYLVEKLQLLALGRTLAGCVLNIVANLVLIPRYGVIGAAISTLLSQAMATYLFDLLDPRTRPAWRMKTRALWVFGKSPL